MTETGNKPKMHHRDGQVLDRVFEIDEHDASKTCDVPESLSRALYKIADAQNASQNPMLRISPAWLGGAIAAGLAFCVFFFNAQLADQQTIELRKAQHDLETAFFYLNQTNQIVEGTVLSTLRDNIQRSTVVPVFHSTNSIKLNEG